MRATISFPVGGSHRMEPTWPVKLGERVFNLTVRDGIIKAVSVTFPGVDVSHAPEVAHDETKPIKMSINIAGSYRLRAERDIRAWQAIMAAYINLDIGFDDATMSYNPESIEEEARIQIKEFTSKKTPRQFSGRDEFSIYGRAFLAVEHGYDQIDRMAFYLDAVRAMEAQRPIDAYNNFYLWFESNYGVPFKTKDAVRSLARNQEFVDALKQAAADAESRPNSANTALKACLANPLDVEQLIKEIVLLRGFLRHHSLSNPARWDPANQGRYTEEAQFLGGVAFIIAFPQTIGRTWDVEYGEEFNRQAEEMHCMTEVHAVLTFREEEHTREAGLNLRFPTTQPSPALAKAVLEKVLEAFDEKSPGAQLYGIRARVVPHGPELFRYDLGPGMNR
ncbi:hypothetical protein [Sphingomonas paucimobilis]|uniref:Uncharacterized protein n=1 Tax=Sphingomonas paucimobilis TaxID=13689 RepID=A0A7Y2KTC6_SPHPI|nr:hypothetical protein [Sphingomonas paucimobilis]NNG59789.1 hypothetical protein [Sphingomonas paucimobilis]